MKKKVILRISVVIVLLLLIIIPQLSILICVNRNEYAYQ